MLKYIILAAAFCLLPACAADAPLPPPPPQLPPPPDLPVLPKGATPPAAVFGVIGVPDIMRISSAAEQVNKTIGERRDKLNQDAQKEQNEWLQMRQSLEADHAKLSPDQLSKLEAYCAIVICRKAATSAC